ncbi:MAG: hypothetical protein GY821_12195 [Gammaproteobacteria bacterium]|nr:hypothetical protein [Gammaproteobacteria bacterium]
MGLSHFRLDNADEAMPIVLDLNKDGFTFSRPLYTSVLFDADADGQLENIAWIADPQDGWLVYDKDNDDAVTDINEISFTQYVDGAKTDLEGLRAFDSNNDNLLDSHDDQYDLFKVWIDSNINGISEEGELVGLSQLGIIGLDLHSDNQLTIDGDVTI